MGPLLIELFARSSQAATTAANSFFDGGLPTEVCQPRISDDALAGATASPVAQATSPSKISNAAPRTGFTPAPATIPAATLKARPPVRQPFRLVKSA